MMKLLPLFLFAILATIDALTPASGGRRAFLSKVAGTTVASVATIAAPAIAADKYNLDFDESVVPKTESPKSSGGSGGLIVGGALGGGLLLSLPFFAPNLARLAGIKNAKLKMI